MHTSLDNEIINKIINIYTKKNNDNINNIEYNQLLNQICNDAQRIIDNSKYMNINKKFDNSQNQNKNQINTKIKDKPNYKSNILPNIKIIDNNKNNDSFLNQSELYKVKKIISTYSKEKFTNLITYKEFHNLLNKNGINDKTIENLFEFKDMNNEKLIDLTECILILNKIIKRNIAKELSHSLNKLNVDIKKDRLYITNYINTFNNRQRNGLNSLLLTDNTFSLSQDNYSNSINDDILKDNDNIIKHINHNEELIIQMINLLKEKIYEEGKKQDKIYEYFDVLLSHNEKRKENTLNPSEFENALKNEGFNFSSQDIFKLFNYFDNSHKGCISRTQFFNVIKKIPFPITVIQKYFKSNKISVFDIAFKMYFDIYNTPFEAFSNFEINQILFISKMKSINREFDKDFLLCLYSDLLIKSNNKLTVEKMFEIFNVYNKSRFTFYNIYENKENIMNIVSKAFYENVTFKELKEKILSYENSSKGILKYNEFYKVINFILKGKLEEQNLLHFLRISQLIDINNDIYIIHFLRFIDSRYPDDSFAVCVKQLAEYLIKECNGEIFIFNVKMNNMNNNSTTNTIINPERLFYLFKEKNEFLKFETINKFDYNGDGKISIDDIKNIIIKYYDKHFFDNERLIKENKKKEEDNILYKQLINFYIYIIELLKKNNLSENKFFIYLDKNKDELVDKEEFINQLLLLPFFEKEKFDIKEIETFFDFLDEFKANKINIDTYQRKFLLLHDQYYKENKDNIYFKEKGGYFILEDLILNEFCYWYKNNKNTYTTEEIFSMMDKDNDGIISTDDFKNFIIQIFWISPNELFDKKISNLINAISLNKENNNISLADIQQFIDCINKNDMKKYKEKIIVNYIKDSNNNNIWIKYIINELKLYINQKYGEDIEKMYKEYDIHFYQNKGQGLSFDNFEFFISKNLGIFEHYHLKKKELHMLFNYISNKKKFITLNDLKTAFGNSISNRNNNNISEQLKDNNDFIDFYENMHKIIKKFLNDNFNTCRDAFNFFKNNLNDKKEYITIKEFYNGINSLFPKKYDTQTILNYFQKIFRKNIITNENKTNELETISYKDFKEAYYKNIIGVFNDIKNKYNDLIINDSINISEKRYLMTLSVDRKKRNNSKTIIFDPIEKMKRIIRHSEKNSKKELIENYINEIQSSTINKYQFYNLLKKLNLGLTNTEIEDIILNEGFSCDGFIDLYKFNKIIFKDDYHLNINKRHIEERLSEIKLLIIKYYTSPLLAFELNITNDKKFLELEGFKRVMYEIYRKEKKEIPSFPLLKCLFDYIDYKKDGVITIEEWNHIFSKIKTNLDLDTPYNLYIRRNNNKIINLKEWENSNEMIKIFKLISRNRKLIKEKFKLFSVASSCLLIRTNDLINILKEILYNINLTNEQWKAIINIGKKDRSEYVDFKSFITIIEYASKII